METILLCIPGIDLSKVTNSASSLKIPVFCPDSVAQHHIYVLSNLDTSMWGPWLLDSADILKVLLIPIII